MIPGPLKGLNHIRLPSGFPFRVCDLHPSDIGPVA